MRYLLVFVIDFIILSLFGLTAASFIFGAHTTTNLGIFQIGFIVIVVLFLVQKRRFTQLSQESFAFGPVRPMQYKRHSIGKLFLLLAVVLSFLSNTLHILINIKEPTAFTDLATIVYVLSITVFLLGAMVLSKRKLLTFPNKLEYIVVLSLLVLSAGIRLYHLSAVGHLPEDLLWLEHAKQIINRTVRSPFLFVGDLSTNMPAYPIALLYSISGNIDISARLPSVIYSVIFLSFLYALGKELFGRSVGLWALILAGLSIWDVHNSRLAWYNLSTNPLLITGSLLFLVRSIKQHDIFDVTVCGFFVGMAINLLYIPALMVMVVSLYWVIFWIISIARHHRDQRGHAMHWVFQQIAFFLLSLAIFSGPTVIKVVKYPESLTRHNEFIEQNAQFSTKSSSRLSYYSGQFIDALRYFGHDREHYRSDGPWGPALSLPMVFLYVIGLGYSVTRIRSASFSLLLLTWAALFIPVVILYITGSVWRLMDFEPLVYLFAACGLVLLVNTLNNFAPRVPVFTNKIISSVICCLPLVASSTYEFRNYYYLRTNESQNHIFQLCKNLENRLNTYSFTELWVGDDWCGITLATVYGGKKIIRSMSSFKGQFKINSGQTAMFIILRKKTLSPWSGTFFPNNVGEPVTLVMSVGDQQSDEVVDVYSVAE